MFGACSATTHFRYVRNFFVLFSSFWQAFKFHCDRVHVFTFPREQKECKWFTSYRSCRFSFCSKENNFWFLLQTTVKHLMQLDYLISKKDYLVKYEQVFPLEEGSFFLWFCVIVCYGVLLWLCSDCTAGSYYGTDCVSCPQHL